MNTIVRVLTLCCLLAVMPAAAGAELISASKLSAQLDSEGAPIILDVRSKQEYDAGHVPGAVHVPYDELPGRLSELPTDKQQEIVVYCEVGGRAAIATNVLEDAGYSEVQNLAGHMRQWRADNLPQE